MNSDEISQIVAEACRQSFNVAAEPQVSSAEPEFGDFATNVAFGLAKGLKMAPRAIAEQVADAISHPHVESARAAGAGFINLVMKPQYWIDQLSQIDENYGASQLGRGRKLQVEFISANPTGPLTLGNARGGFTGDVLASVLAKCGYQVTREYYFNDGGTQISKLVASIKNAAGLKVEGDIQYKGQYIEELARDLKPQLDRPEQEIGEQATQLIFERFIKPAIAKMGVHFDVWFNEKDLMSSGQQAKAFDRLRRENLLYEQDGALWLRSSSYGDDKDRVLVKSNGDPTYLGNDIAYHLNIFEQRNFDIAFKIWGADHMANVASLGLTVKKLLPDKQLVFVINQFVRLVRDGQEYRISKRAGTYVTVEELIDEISSDVARFFFLMRSADSHMDFDLDLAKQQSQKNPYWYVMYAYVRANSILSQAEKQGLKAAAETRRLNDLERQLVKQMARFPGLLREIAGDYGVHRLTFYGLELSRTFHDYYESERIIDLKANEASQKLYLIQQYLQFMRIFFDLLGITPIKKM